VVDYEDEPPSKINGVASTNGNGYDKDDDSDSDYGEMPPLPVIKVRLYSTVLVELTWEKKRK
jgi:hypothetical protein